MSGLWLQVYFGDTAQGTETVFAKTTVSANAVSTAVIFTSISEERYSSGNSVVCYSRDGYAGCDFSWDGVGIHQQNGINEYDYFWNKTGAAVIGAYSGWSVIVGEYKYTIATLKAADSGIDNDNFWYSIIRSPK